MIKASLTESACTKRTRDIYISAETGVSAQTSANTETEAKDGFDLSAKITLRSGTGVNTNIDIIACHDTFRLDGTVCEFDVPPINTPLFEGGIFSRTVRPIAPATARSIARPTPQSGSA